MKVSPFLSSRMLTVGDILILVRYAEVSKQNGRKGPGVGFIKDYKRANVALTRAKQHLWIVGNSEVLKTSELWRKLVRQLEQRKVANAMGNFKCMYSNWKSRQE